MTEATATFDVRRHGPASVVDIKGDVTAASEDVLMEAYQGAGDVQAIVLNFAGQDPDRRVTAITLAIFVVAIVGWVYEYYRGNFAR